MTLNDGMNNSEFTPTLLPSKRIAFTRNKGTDYRRKLEVERVENCGRAIDPFNKRTVVVWDTGRLWHYLGKRRGRGGASKVKMIGGKNQNRKCPRGVRVSLGEIKYRAHLRSESRDHPAILSFPQGGRGR